MFYWDILINIWHKYEELTILKNNLSPECLGILDARLVLNYKLMPVNYFNEVERAKCRRKTQEYNMIDYFEKVVKKDKSITDDYEKIIEGNGAHIYFRMKIIACSEFNPEWAYTLIKHYGARRVLDMSAGRGARLLGAMLAGCDYYLGIDPNEATNINNRTMGSFYKYYFNLKTEFDFIDSGFEVPWEEKLLNTNKNLFTGKSEMRKFDMMISSPPYYDLEIYVSEDKSSGDKSSENKFSAQSIWNKSFEEWLDEFFIFSICKAIKFIKTGGYIIINIDNSVNKLVKEDYTTPLITSKKIRQAGAKYLGYYRLKDIVPCTFWVFQKL